MLEKKVHRVECLCSELWLTGNRVLFSRQTAEEEGADFERKELLKYSAEDVERWEKKLQEKAERAETGFTGALDTRACS
jgi:hypothetical protein